jgi:hypothetical protein
MELVWRIFQSRLLFPSYIALLLVFSASMEWAEFSRLKIIVVRRLLIALFVPYTSVEVWLAIYYPVNPLRIDHVPFKLICMLADR